MNRLVLAIWTIAIIPLILISCTAQEKIGTLALVANGEDFIRKGFVSKDGWQINFDHAYVTLAQVNAYQTELPLNSAKEIPLKPKQAVSLLDKATTIDLAEGEEDAEPIFVTQADAPVGRYNALAWQLVSAQQGSAKGNSLVLAGTAIKDNQSIDFVISFDQELKYTCGEYVGENRKGIVQVRDIAQVETTFHFDTI